MRNDILVLGYFGYVTNQLDGQTVKTRDILKLLQQEYPNRSVGYFDTQQLKGNKLAGVTMLKQVCSCKSLVYLPAYGNLKIIFPILFVLSVLFRFEIQYFVVGGWLCNYIKTLPIHRWMLRRIKAIHVETKHLDSDLKVLYGYKNVDIFPNFRFFDARETRSSAVLTKLEDDVQPSRLRLVFISRVMKDKGLDMLHEVYAKMKSHGNDSLYSIDFYGEMKDDYFNQHMSNVTNYAYKGILDPSSIIDTIKQYDALIFPTHYEGEGCPGILVEALAAGVPIIASDWKYNSEFVIPNVNGFLCRFDDVDNYVDAIMALNGSKTLVADMGKASQEIATQFSDKYARELILSYFGK
jgi:glycosyltransferase involved in cell wall biosynthesis